MLLERLKHMSEIASENRRVTSLDGEVRAKDAAAIEAFAPRDFTKEKIIYVTARRSKVSCYPYPYPPMCSH